MDNETTQKKGKGMIGGRRLFSPKEDNLPKPWVNACQGNSLSTELWEG